MRRPGNAVRALAAFQVGAMLLALAMVGHHRATGHQAPRIARSSTSAGVPGVGDAGAAALHNPAAPAADRDDCQLCHASHVRYVPAATAPATERVPSVHVAKIAPPDRDAPVVAVDWLTAPKTSPPV